MNTLYFVCEKRTLLVIFAASMVWTPLSIDLINIDSIFNIVSEIKMHHCKKLINNNCPVTLTFTSIESYGACATFQGIVNQTAIIYTK